MKVKVHCTTLYDIVRHCTTSYHIVRHCTKRTFMVATKEFNSHRDVAIPSFRIYSDVACLDGRGEVIRHNRIPIVVTLKCLFFERK